MLPGPDGIRIADMDRLASHEGLHHVRHQAICRPIPASDHIACAGGGDPACILAVKEAAAIGSRDDLRARFAAAVRIESAERITLTEWLSGSGIFIAFVACNDGNR